MKTILYSVSTGYFARNLLRTGVIERLLEHKDIRIVIVTLGYDDENFIKEFSFDERIIIEKMYDIDRSYNFMDKLIWKMWILGHRYKYFQNLYILLLRMQIKKRYYDKFHNYYGRIFDRYNPELVVSATPGINSRGDMPILAEAQRRRIRTLAIIHSWDNIARRKGPMWFRPDMLGVWNEFQKNDAITVNFYKEKDIKLVGPVHYDIYWQEDTFMSRDIFFEKMGLDPNKKLITMIATVPGLVSNSYIVDILLDALKRNKFVFPVQLICRPTPSVDYVNDTKMNDLEFGKFYNEPGIIIDRQIQYSPTLGWNPDRNQLFHFANLVKYSDVQVNIASTATIEAAILDRPVVNVAFSTIQPEEFKKFIIESVFENHFKPILDYGASYIAKDPDDLIEGINRYLLDPCIHRDERKQLKEAIVYKADGKATDRASQTILNLLNNHPE